MLTKIFEFIREYISLHLAVALCAALPFIEVKGAIPLGVIAGLKVAESSIWAYFGSMLPVPFLLIGMHKFLAFLRTWAFSAKYADKIENKISAKRSLIDRYGYLGLFLFVAFPVPGTGVWSGAVLANFLRLNLFKSFLMIAIGNAIGTFFIHLITYSVRIMF